MGSYNTGVIKIGAYEHWQKKMPTTDKYRMKRLSDINRLVAELCVEIYRMSRGLRH